ncbi:hypothetical protein LINPERHAP1_LOCUS7284 [Linum perenne]
MEKTFSFGAVKRRLESLWARTGTISVSDVANSFFLVRFSDDSDYQRAAFGGPWKIYDYYFSVARWSPSFNEEEPIKSILTWVRLPKLPIHFFNRLAVTRIGNCIGKTVKLDLATSEGARARYARVCVEVDLSKPLLGKYLLEDKTYYVEYESLENICVSCGIYGHKLDACVPPIIPAQEGATPETELTFPETQEVEKATGEWMIVTRKSRGRPKKDPMGSDKVSASGSRFRILHREAPASSVEPPKNNSSSEPSDVDSIIAEHAAQLSQILKQASQPKGNPTDAKAALAKTPKSRKPLADMTNRAIPQPPTTPREGEPASKEGAQGSLFSVPITYTNPIFQGVADKSIKTKVVKPSKKNEKKGSSSSVRSVDKLKTTAKGAGKPTRSFMSKKPQVVVEAESVPKTGKPPDQA